MHERREYELCLYSFLLSGIGSDWKIFWNVKVDCNKNNTGNQINLKLKATKDVLESFMLQIFTSKHKKFLDDIYFWNQEKLGWINRFNLIILT